MKISGWGRFPRQDCQVHTPRTADEVAHLVAGGSVIARGNGRSYGDSALNRRSTVDMRHFNRMLAFDAQTGQLVVEAGVLLADVIKSFLPRGWFPYVTPGTKFVTLGGMVAADVHGKNHHGEGSFGQYVDWLDIMGDDGRIRRCSRTQNLPLFSWTLGGLGLTGVVLRVAFRLRRVETGWIKQNLLPAPNLDTAMALFEAHEASTYSVAWIDCLATGAAMGRSALMLGEHATLADLGSDARATPYAVPKRLQLPVPFNAPSFTLNRWSVRAFNQLYYQQQVRKTGHSLIDWDRYFYPLDMLSDWNRLYGRRGLVQFQSVLPLDAAKAGLTEMLQAVSNSGQSAFLAVLKRMGAQQNIGESFSFPQTGYTLAMDFPVSRKVLALLERLDAITIAHGGRFYLAKDARMRAETLRAADPRVSDFVRMRRTLPVTAFDSSQAERLDL